MFLAPAKGVRNVIGTFTVSVSPFIATVVFARFSEHWLFSNVAPAPGVAGCPAVPASLSKLIWLVEML